MPKTRDELTLRVAEILRVAGAGQPLQAEDKVTIENITTPEIARLERTNVYRLDYPTSIPDEAFEALANLIALRAGVTFGFLPIEGFSSLRDAQRFYEMELEELETQNGLYPTLAANYF